MDLNELFLMGKWVWLQKKISFSFWKVIELRRILHLSLTILLLFISLGTIIAQSPVKLRSVLSAGGLSRSFSLDGQQYFIQQSIGQTGAIGLSQNNKHQLRQGFIQPVSNSINRITDGNLQVTVSPNPFSSHINVTFNEEKPDILFVTIYDLSGKIVYLKKYGAVRELNISADYLAPAVYIIRVNTTTNSFYSTLIKH
jgi:hypothetical protein